MFQVRELQRSFNNKHVLRGVTFGLEECSIVGLIGPSGGGKSVLLKIMGGILEADSGSIDSNLQGTEEISLMFQEGALFDSLNVFDNIAFPLVQGKVPTFTLPPDVREEVHQKVSTVLSQVGLLKAAQKLPGQLSGGMRKRVSLARALVAKPKIVLLDDPTSGLDPVASSVIMDLIVELHHSYKPTTLMVSHDLRRLLPVVDHIIALFDGKISFAGCLADLKKCESSELHHFVSCRYDFKNIQ